MGGGGKEGMAGVRVLQQYLSFPLQRTLLSGRENRSGERRKRRRRMMLGEEEGSHRLLI